MDVVRGHDSTIESSPLSKTTKEAPTCAYPGCKNELQQGEDGAEVKYCGLPDPVSGQPHTALASFRRHQELAAQGGVTEPKDPEHQGGAFWHPRRRHRAEEQCHEQAEAAVEEARSAVLEAEARAVAAESRAKAAEQEAAQARQELDKDRKVGGLSLTSEGSLLSELVKGVNEAVDWLIDRDS